MATLTGMGSVNLDDLAFLVESASRAGAVRHRAFPAVGTVAQRGGFEGMVRPAHAGLGLRFAVFWVSHFLFLYFSMKMRLSPQRNNLVQLEGFEQPVGLEIDS
jgi:hypothetical protein